MVYLILGAKIITLYFIWRVGWMIFTQKKSQIFLQFFFSLYFLYLLFSCYFCSRDLKRQSEQSGLCPDTSKSSSIYQMICSELENIAKTQLESCQLITSERMIDFFKYNFQPLSLKELNKSLINLS